MLVGVAVTAVLFVALSAMVLNNFPEGGRNMLLRYFCVVPYVVPTSFVRLRKSRMCCNVVRTNALMIEIRSVC